MEIFFGFILIKRSKSIQMYNIRESLTDTAVLSLNIVGIFINLSVSNVRGRKHISLILAPVYDIIFNSLTLIKQNRR